MTVRRHWGAALGLLAVLAAGYFFVAPKMSGQADEPKAKGAEPPGKGQRAQEFIAAFNKGDAKAVAAFYTPDGDYVDQTGRQYKGRAALEKLYEKVFAERKGAKLNIIVTSTRMI